MADRVGQQLGTYRLVRLLGAGGFAEVYLGEHVHLGTQAAIKVLSTKLGQAEIKRFREEARTIAGLRHPSIVRVLDFDVEEGLPYLVMDYAPGGTLRKRHPRGTRLAPSTILPYVRQVASALQFAHERKLIHRDVKPENMLVGEHGEVLLSDFGIAVVAHSSLSQTSQEVVGTFAYMAPEQIESHPRPTRDQYSLGIVIYEWLAGERPFSGSSQEILAKHISVAPAPLRDKLLGLAPQVEAVVMTALAKDPRQRFASIQAFANAFEQAGQATEAAGAATEAVAQKPTPAPERTTPVPPERAPREAEPALAMELEPTQPDMTTPTDQPVPTPKARPGSPGVLSRRRLLIGSGAVVALAAVGGGILLTRHSGPGEQSPGIQPLYIYRGQYPFIVYSAAWSPDGQRITSGSDDNSVRVWDATTGDHALLFLHLAPVLTVAWPFSGNLLASGGFDNTVRVWDVTADKLVYTYRGHTDVVTCVAWSPKKQRIASGAGRGDKTVQVWDAPGGGNLFTYRGHADTVGSVAWSPDGTLIVSGGWDNTVQVWKAATGDHIAMYSGHSHSVYSVAWSPDGQYIASGSVDNTVQVWAAMTGTHVFTYRGHSDIVESVAWSPNGQRIASGSADKTAQVWDAITGGNRVTYRGHTDVVTSVAWSPNGLDIASSSEDGTVQVWKAAG